MQTIVPEFFPGATSGFFFSSRRRHTCCYRDWSSDVCSSDLVPLEYVFGEMRQAKNGRHRADRVQAAEQDDDACVVPWIADLRDEANLLVRVRPLRTRGFHS